MTRCSLSSKISAAHCINRYQRAGYFSVLASLLTHIARAKKVEMASEGNHGYREPCQLLLLHPVRFCLHVFLTAKDAIHLMQTSSAITAAILSDYAFVDHVFAARSEAFFERVAYQYPFVDHDFVEKGECTAADIKRTIAFHSRYHMRILRMCLPGEWNEPLTDSESGQSVLPASLLALSLGQEFEHSNRRSAAFAAFDGGVRREGDVEWDSENKEKQLDERFVRWVRDKRCDTWGIFQQYGGSQGAFNQPLPPDALPHGLRFLQFNESYNQPLQVGSIPDTVEVLQFGGHFNQPLEVGHLPASLTHLVFGARYNRSLSPGVLPARLKRLHLGGGYNHPITPGTLPVELQRLSFGWTPSQRVAANLSLTRVSFARPDNNFGGLLQPDSIPHGVVYIHLGAAGVTQPLLPGVLPVSLRELALDRCYNQPLLPGSLPARLELLAFHPLNCYHTHSTARRHSSQCESGEYEQALRAGASGGRHTGHSKMAAAASRVCGRGFD